MLEGFGEKSNVFPFASGCLLPVETGVETGVGMLMGGIVFGLRSPNLNGLPPVGG